MTAYGKDANVLIFLDDFFEQITLFYDQIVWTVLIKNSAELELRTIEFVEIVKK
jgi:hypothetical protein